METRNQEQNQKEEVKEEEKQIRFPELSNEGLIRMLTFDSSFTELLIERIWRQMFFWATFFESLDGFTNASDGGSISINGMNIVLNSSATSGKYAELVKQPGWQGVTTFYAKNMFRTAVVFNSNSNQEAYLVFGSLNDKYYGFKVEDDTLYGVVNDGSTETKVKLQTISASEVYNLEAIYYPKNKVVFYVNAGGMNWEPKGIITSGLMKPEKSVVTHIMDLKIKTKENASKTMQLSFWQYLQARTYNK